MAEIAPPRASRDAGLQPERTSLAWRRTFLVCCAVFAVILKAHIRSGDPALVLALAGVIGPATCLLAWEASQRRCAVPAGTSSLTAASPTVKLAIALIVLGLAILAAVPRRLF